MRIHRFYVPELELKQDFWLHDEDMLHQWNRVLRFSAGQQVLLFDGQTTDRLYRITEIKLNEAHLELVTEYVRNVPTRSVIMAWSILKRDKNDWVLQKCTELGVSHFVPIRAQRSERTDISIERSRRIIIEASEQSGRSDIPSLREPLQLTSFIDEMKERSIPVLICEKGTEQPHNELPIDIALLIGPEGGWAEQERELFKNLGLAHIDLGNFTLRAETACIVSAAMTVRAPVTD